MRQKIYSFLYWFLIKISSYRQRGRLHKFIWNRLWSISTNKYQGEIDFKLHGEKVKMNNGYPYPLFINTFYNYNHPLIEIVYQVYKLKGKAIDYIDIGAAIGDTMLLLFKTCPGMINRYFCIDGDAEFYNYLQYNLRNYNNGYLYNVLLTDPDSLREKSLVRTHMGTASAQGIENKTAVTLDSLLYKPENTNIDLIKVDVDGLDGKVISGATNIIEKYRPTIIFEWYPFLIQKTENDIYQPFELLKKYKYTKFIFYNKYGYFDHLHYEINKNEISFLANYCLNYISDEEWHYDVIAIHDSLNLDLWELAELAYSKKF